jgi:ABC-2 type transport system ATP-binding protein
MKSSLNPSTQPPAPSPRERSAPAPRILFDNVSRFYGEVLGVNRVNLSIQPGITSLVGPNGSGKTTLMNLMAGLIRPSRGTIDILGIGGGGPPPPPTPPPGC